MQCCALPSSFWFLNSARRENVGFLEFQMSLRGVLGLGRGRFLKNLIYSVMPIQWTFSDDRFQKYVHCIGIIFDFQGILMKIAFFLQSRR
jgi:hypothetical protein